MDERPVQSSRLPWFVAFLARRLVWAAVTLLIFVAVVVLVMQGWVPYSWESRLARGPVADDRNYLGLYVDFIAGLVRGDLGTSLGGIPVGNLLRDALPVTLTVFLVGTVIGWLVGEMLGRIGAWSRSRLAGSTISTAGVLSAAIFPPFLVFVLVFVLRGPMLALRDAIGMPRDSLDLWRDYVIEQEGALSPTDVRWAVALALSAAMVGALVVRAIAKRYRLRWVEVLALPAALLGTAVGVWASGLGPHVLDLLYRVEMTVTTGRGSPVLAMIGIALLSFGQVLLLMRAGMDAQRDEDYVATGRAKGLPEHVVRDHHAARNAVAPVLAGSFLTFPTVLAGMMLVEYELEMQGLSSVLFAAVESQDIPVIMGIFVVLGVIGIGFRLVTDIAIASLDPRQRRARA